MADYQGNYKKYSLAQLEEWIHDTLNCEDITPEEIYKTITDVVDDTIEYHKTYLTKSIELLSLLKGHRPSFEIDASLDDINAGICSLTDDDCTEPVVLQYTDKEMDAMCDAAADKEKCREFNLREAEYYNKRAQLDLEHSKWYWDKDRNK